MSSISGLSSYNAASYTSQLLSKLTSSSTEDSQQTNPFDQTSTQESGSSSSTETKRHRQISSLDDSTLQALLQGMETSSTSSTEAVNTENMVTAMDTDSDGTITQEEFVAARPDDVSEDMANSLWSQFDTESAGSLSTDEMQTAMASGRPHGPPPPPPEDEEDDDEDDTTVSSTDDSGSLQDILGQILDEASGTTSSEETSSFVSSLDTDGDGTVTQEEFIAARPDDVSEEMATNLWNSFDTEGVGSLSTSDLQTAMADSAPPPPPGGMQMASDSSSSAYQDWLDQLTSDDDSPSTTSTSSTTSATSQGEALQAFLEAVQAYESTAGYGATRDVLSSLLAMA